MDDVESVRLLDNSFEHENMMRQRINAVPVQPQRLVAARHQVCGCFRITAGEKRHVVPHAYEFFGQIGHHSLRPSVQFWRYTLMEWCNLRDSHLCQASLLRQNNAVTTTHSVRTRRHTSLSLICKLRSCNVLRADRRGFFWKSIVAVHRTGVSGYRVFFSAAFTSGVSPVAPCAIVIVSL